MDREFSYGEFVSYLEHAEILKSVAISRNLEGFRDVKGLRHLVCRWCPSLHTFFSSVSEITITLEDVVNNFLSLCLVKRILSTSILPVRISNWKTNYLDTLAGVLLPLVGNWPEWASRS